MPYLRKTNFDSFYERKLLNARQEHQVVANKQVMARAGLGPKEPVESLNENSSQQPKAPKSSLKKG